MEKQELAIGDIPAVLWGPAARRLYIAVHGDQSHKEDAVIRVFAGEAVRKGCRVLSADLPGHGGRRGGAAACTPWQCAADLKRVMEHARSLSDDIRLFGCSVGAYFGMLAYQGQPLRQALFLSPVVDMRRLIDSMMAWHGVSRERLEAEGTVETPGKTLSWKYYRYVTEHALEWPVPTALLRGDRDTLSEYGAVRDFSDRWGAEMTVMKGGEHYFHTDEQLDVFRKWAGERVAP